MSYQLTNKVAIVTGGASGIGRAIVEAFIRAGARGVMVADVRTPDDDLLQRTGVAFTETDISSGDDVRQMVSETVERFGRVDILVNNAGIAPIVRWPDVTEENWRHVLDVNLNGAMLCAMNVLPHMRRQKNGRIINISSAGAFLGSITAHPAYGVAKAGLIALTKSLARECAADGILVNTVSPGSVDTPILESFGAEEAEFYADRALLKRHGKPAELADAVLFLVSDASTYITGSTLHVNGGSLLI